MGFALNIIKSLLVVALLFISSGSAACFIDPSSSVIADPKSAYENASEVFYGKVISTIAMEDGNEVTISVEKVWKGTESSTKVVFNDLRSSCSRLLITPDEYVVFARINEIGGLEVTGEFVAVERARSVIGYLNQRTRNETAEGASADN